MKATSSTAMSRGGQLRLLITTTAAFLTGGNNLALQSFVNRHLTCSLSLQYQLKLSAFSALRSELSHQTAAGLVMTPLNN